MQLGLFSTAQVDAELDYLIESLQSASEAASAALSADRKAALSQYFTPMAIAKLMAQMVERDDVSSVGDYGAGTGILSSTLIAMKHGDSRSTYRVSAYEIDNGLHPVIQESARQVGDYIDPANCHPPVSALIRGDLMLDAEKILSGDAGAELDAIVLNPPYRKLHQQTATAQLFRVYGVAVPNLYAAFIVLSVMMLKPGGELVAIVPRSFCNGDYYKSFREWLLAQGSVDWFVRYKRRSNVFKNDNVLQENVIFRFTRSVQQAPVVRVSLCDEPDQPPLFEGVLPASDVLDTHSGAIHIPTSSQELDAIHSMAQRPASFSDMGLTVSTGKLELNRLEQFMSFTRYQNSAPVVYSQHWKAGCHRLSWNDLVSKPCYVELNDLTKKKCLPSGRYIFVKRISANDDRSGRCHACLVFPEDISGDTWAIDNHIQVISPPATMTDHQVCQIIGELSSPTINDFFRVVSGTTQLNCNDIRKLRFWPCAED